MSKNGFPEQLQPFEKAPIYRAARQILLNVQSIVAHMPQKHKYVTGTKLNDACFDLCDVVSWAYVEADLHKKAVRLRVVYRKAMGCIILHRIANDLNLMARQMYVDQIDALVSVLRQVQGWMDKNAEHLSTGQVSLRKDSGLNRSSQK